MHVNQFQSDDDPDGDDYDGKVNAFQFICTRFWCVVHRLSFVIEQIQFHLLHTRAMTRTRVGLRMNADNAPNAIQFNRSGMMGNA